MKNAIEEKIEREIWEILKQLKRDSVLALGKDRVVYELVKDDANKEYPSLNDQRKIMAKLDHMQVIKIVREHYGPMEDLLMSSQLIRLQGGKPQTFSLEIIKERFDQIYSEYENKFSEKMVLVEKNRSWKGSRPTYDNASRKIKLDDRECEIPKTAYNQQIICEALFPPKRGLGEPVQEYEVKHLFYERRGKDASPRAFYDAITGINRKIEANLKIAKMLKYQDSPARVHIRKELFM